MQEGGASSEAAGGESMELLLAAVSSLDGGEVIDANEQLASVASESERTLLNKSKFEFGSFLGTLRQRCRTKMLQ